LRVMQMHTNGNWPDQAIGKSFWPLYIGDGEGRLKPYQNPEIASKRHALCKIVRGVTKQRKSSS
jgi:hypothetical protein